MQASTRLARNSVWMVLSRFAAQGLAVVFTVVLARRLGSAGFGEYAFIAALIYVANSLTTFGTDMVLIRRIAAQDDLSPLPAALAVQLALSTLVILAAWGFGAHIPNQSPETVLALRIYVLALIPMAFFTVFSTALRGKQRMDAYAVLNLLIAALQAAVVLVRNLDLVTLSVFFLAVQIIIALAAAWMCSAAIPRFWAAWSLRMPALWPLARACAPLALLTVLGMAYQRLGIYMLSTMGSAADTGLFSAAARTVEASKTVHLALFAALYPAMALARNQAVPGRDLSDGIRTSRNLLLAASAAGAAILFAFARPVVSLLYGSAYLASVPVLRILAWTLVPFTLNSYLTLSFLASNRELLVARALAASLLGLLVLNLWLIPAMGPTGGAWAALTAECVQAVILLLAAQAHATVKGAAHELPDLPG